MKADTRGPESIEARVERNRVVQPLWTRTNEVTFWLAVAGGPAFAFLATLDAELVWISSAWATVCAAGAAVEGRKRVLRRGSALAVDSEGVALERNGLPEWSIPWRELRGVAGKGRRIEFVGEDGLRRTVIRPGGSGRDMEDLRRIVRYVAERTSLVREDADLLPAPLPVPLARRRLWVFGHLTLVAVVGLAIASQWVIAAERFDLWTIVGVVLGGGAVVCVLAVAMTRQWMQLELHKWPHLWDKAAPAPPLLPANADEHWREHRKDPPVVELVEGVTYVHRNYGVDRGSLAFSAVVGVPFGMLTLAAPLIVFLDASHPYRLMATVIVACLSVPIGVLVSVGGVWSAFAYRPYLSKYRLERGRLVIAYKGRERSVPHVLLVERVIWPWSRSFGCAWEVYGDESGRALIDRRYLRPLVEGERFYSR